MAVEDKYVNTEIAADKLANPAQDGGAKLIAFVSTFEVAIADEDGSVYRVGKALQPNVIPLLILITNDEITAGTDYDLGLYETDLGPVINKEVFAAGISMASARATGSSVSGLSAVDVANMDKKIYEHAGDTVKDYKSGYDLAVTANTVGSAVGTITIAFVGMLG